MGPTEQSNWRMENPVDQVHARAHLGRVVDRLGPGPLGSDGEGGGGFKQLTGGANEHQSLTSRTKMSYMAVWVGLVHGQGSHVQCV